MISLAVSGGLGFWYTIGFIAMILLFIWWPLMLIVPSWRRRLCYGLDYNVRNNLPFMGIGYVRSLIPMMIAGIFLAVLTIAALVGWNETEGFASNMGLVGFLGLLISGCFVGSTRWFARPRFMILRRYRYLDPKKSVEYNSLLLPPPPPPGMYRRPPGLRGWVKTPPNKEQQVDDSNQQRGKHEAS